MPQGWAHLIGRIVALVGVLGLLLIGGPAGFGTAAGRVDANASRHDPAASRQILVGLSNLDQAGASTPDCPHQHSRDCCAVAGCPAMSIVPTAAALASMAWLGVAVDFAGRGTAVPDGVMAMPLTPPPRRPA